MKPLVMLPDPIDADGVNLLIGRYELFAPWLTPATKAPTSGDSYERAMAAAAAVVVRTWAINEARLEQMPELRVVVKHGAGVDNINIDAASRRGVLVVSTPDAVSTSVAEFTIALLLAVARRIPLATHRDGERSRLIGTELQGKTLGVVGLGRIGRRVASIASAGLGMNIIGFDPFLHNQCSDQEIVLVETLDSLIAEADAVTLHVPLTPDTRRLIDDRRLRLLKSSALFVNTSRGAIVDDQALATALREGRLAGAALDVVATEDAGALLRSLGAIVTPHIASSTAEALRRTAIASAQAVLAALTGQTPPGTIHNARPLV